MKYLWMFIFGFVFANCGSTDPFSDLVSTQGQVRLDWSALNDTGECDQFPAASNVVYENVNDTVRIRWKDSEPNILNYFETHVFCETKEPSSIFAVSNVGVITPGNSVDMTELSFSDPACSEKVRSEQATRVDFERNGIVHKSCPKFLVNYAPTGFTATVDGKNIVLSWIDDFQYNASFEVRYQNLSTSEPEEVLALKRDSYSFTNEGNFYLPSFIPAYVVQETHARPKPNSLYGYRIRACYFGEYCAPWSPLLTVRMPVFPTTAGTGKTKDG